MADAGFLKGGGQGKVASAKREQNFVTPPQQLVIDHACGVLQSMRIL